jgi:hypothetical protein
LGGKTADQEENEAENKSWFLHDKALVEDQKYACEEWTLIYTD